MVNIFEIWFSVLPISSKMKIEIIKDIYDFETIYNLRNELFNKLSNFNKILAINLNSDKIKKIESDIKNREYLLISYNHIDYPIQFKFIDDPPFNIYYKGDIKVINSLTFLGVVGSRKYTSYGDKMTTKIVSELFGQTKIGIVSGGALGIDTRAHEVAIENKIFNVAILGCGIDVVYPKSNKKLFFNIVQNGVVMTEFLPGESPMYYNFPKRNRLISALSKALIIVEAGEKSGATNTASHACIQGKTIFAVPGNLDSKMSDGCNLLINDGALIYLNIQQVFKELALSYENVKIDEKYQLKLKIIDILGEEPIHFDKIVEKIKVDRNIINELLFEMQFNNEIIGLIGNNYMKILRNN